MRIEPLPPLQHVFSLTTGKTAKAVNRHDAESAAHASAIESLAAERAKAVEQLFTDQADVASIIAAAQRLTDRRLALLKQAPKILGERLELLPRIEADLRSQEAALAKERDAAFEATAEQLRQAGHGPEHDTRYADNVQAAEIRFTHKVNASVNVRHLSARLEDLKRHIEEIPQISRAIAEQIDIARQKLLQTYEHLIGK